MTTRRRRRRQRQHAKRQTLIGRLLDAAQRRFVRSRSGSVLIMVVALLVLLALIGTAAMSTARLDRISAAQHVKNTQLDIFAESLKNMAIAQTVADLFNTNNGLYRDTATQKTTYEDFDAPGAEPVSLQNDPSDMNYLGHRSYDAWLGSRLPEVLESGNVGWRFVSMPPFASGNGGFQVDAPNEAISGALSMPKPGLVATFMNVKGIDVPAFKMDVTSASLKNPFLENSSTPFMAGDADGDGVADSLMVKLGTVAGLTYYGSYRIVDQNSAVNVNTAMVRDGDFAGDGTNSPTRARNDGLFTSNIGMAEFLADYTIPTQKFTKLSEMNPEFLNVASRKFSINPNKWGPAGLDGGNGNPVGGGSDGHTATALNSFKYRTLADAVFMGLNRRLDNPGFADQNNQFGFGARPYGLGDGFAMAYRFCLVNPSASRSPLEQDLNSSAFLNIGSVPYTPASVKPSTYANAIKTWFALFDYQPHTQLAVRPVFVTNNPTSNAAPTHGTATQALYPRSNDPDPDDPKNPNKFKYLRMSLTPSYPVKISVNTADVSDLWRGFYDLMCSTNTLSAMGINQQSAQTNDNLANAKARNDPYCGNRFAPVTFKNTNEFNEGRMFRSPLRPPTKTTSTYLSVRQMMALRSAIAAKNAATMRDGASNNGGGVGITIKPDEPVQLYDDAGNTPQFDVTVFHGYPQPFITEVFVHTDINPVKPTDPANANKKNPRGFIAVELYNPYGYPINLAGWRLGRIDRSTFPAMRVVPLRDAGTTDSTAEFLDSTGKPVIIGAGERLILYNFNPAAKDTDPDWAHYIPPSAKLVANPRAIMIKELPSVLAKAGTTNPSCELVLLRPTYASDGQFNPKPSHQMYDMMPCDSYDFSGMSLPAAEGGDAEAWHYCRANDENAPTPMRWTFVYPGRYDGSQASRRQQGTEHETWSPVGQDPTLRDEPWAVAPNPLINLGAPDAHSSRNATSNYKANDDPYDFAIQYFAANTPGPDGAGAGVMKFPFGGFARVGDIMHVPFIAAYVVRKTGGAVDEFVEMNSVTMDAAFAEDTDAADDDVEDVGRFCPVVTQPNAGIGQPHAVNDLDFGPTAAYAPAATPRYNYHWATRLFDYFTTINNPHDDYLPNVNPASSEPVANGPQIVDRVQANKTNEDDAPVEGLINLNTAPWRVISALPLIPPSAATADPTGFDRDLNDDVARSIVQYRDRDVNDPEIGLNPHGPFVSLFELDRVPIYRYSKATGGGPPPPFGYFRDLWAANVSNNQDAGEKEGDFTPGNNQTDGVFDFENRYLSVNRISNLVTLRSDCFIAYIQVQAWRNVGSNTTATLEGQRRLAVIIDRSRVSATKKTPIVYNVPTAN